jgi:hypothetical protein
MLLIGNFERIDSQEEYFEIVYEVVSTKELKESYGENISPYIYICFDYETRHFCDLYLFDSQEGRELHYAFKPEEQQQILEMIKKNRLAEDVLAIESIRKTIITHYDKACILHVVFDKKGNVKDFLIHSYGKKPERNILITAFITDELQELRERHGNAFNVSLLDYLVK